MPTVKLGSSLSPEETAMDPEDPLLQDGEQLSNTSLKGQCHSVQRLKLKSTILYTNSILEEGGGGKISHATQNLVKSARVRTIITLL